ncbi:uncharacterized protein LOC122310855 [Carya illinoinensis]|uniref:uncharacterized protein LOC122310855 n=1 Tax=Carya illinoinensis TaxID=32201 RepID=UPI001C71BC0A|nr:uncharacterized protein LOC122310855 [Carya illinoinensis]
MLLTAPGHKPTFLFSRGSASNSVTRTRPCRLCKATLITNSESFEVGRLVGSYGFMNITSYSGFQSGTDIDYSSGDLGRLRVQDVGEGSVKIRLYEGRVSQGPLRGTSILFKMPIMSSLITSQQVCKKAIEKPARPGALSPAILLAAFRISTSSKGRSSRATSCNSSASKVYPGKRASGLEADMMAANELNAHSFLQSSSEGICQNLLILVGGFETKTGEQWLAFRNDGKYSAADYAKVSSEKVSKNRALGEQISWNQFEQEQKIKRRAYFVIKLLQGALRGLAFMHDHDRLHQSLGPSSILLNTIIERDAAYLVPRIRDLAFSVDISYPYLEESPGTLSEGLWRRASAAGAFTLMEKRAFGIADDIYEAGLLFAYLAFIPFCEAGIMDSISLQRLLESTFQLDLQATREYCLADDRLLDAVKFLDLGDGAGWELLQAMLNPDFRKRPIAEAILNHRFITGAVL